MSTISVIIPCYNASKWICAALESVFGSSQLPPEIIVIDDGSTDGTYDLISSLYPSLVVVRTENKGVSAARNLGIQRSKGDYLVFLDADDLLSPDSLTRHYQAILLTHADVVYGDWQRLVADASGIFQDSDVVSRCITGPEDIALFTDFWCPTGAYMFSRRIVEKVGGFRDNLPVIQDARFALDCALHGGKFVYSPGIACRYRVHQSGSVSTRSRTAFWNDVLTNAIEIRAFWEKNGGLSAPRSNALMRVIDGVARAAVALDENLFGKACKLVLELSEHAPLPGGYASRLLTQILGYSTTRRIAAWRVGATKRFQERS